MSIRIAIDKINEEINSLESERLQLQKACKHKVKHEVNYQWRVGSILPAIVCKTCDKLIEFKQ